MTILAFSGVLAALAALVLRIRAEARQPQLRPVTVRARRRPR